MKNKDQVKAELCDTKMGSPTNEQIIVMKVWNSKDLKGHV
jgi:hypothetical protein